jgi:GNAT superfamily N-acetyltransferase
VSAGSRPTTKPLGTIRLVPKTGKIGRLVVAKEYRKYGFGRVLVEAVDEYIKGLNGDRLRAFETLSEVDGKQVVKLALHSQVRKGFDQETMG